LDRQGNDHLGRSCFRTQLFEHRQQILRGSNRPDTNANYNSDPNSDCDTHANSDSDRDLNCDCNAERNIETFADAKG
jgi:hypothetical protein